MSTDVSEKHVASIFWVEAELANFFLLVSCLAYSSTLKMYATCSFEALVDFHRTTWRYIPDNEILHNHPCENL
jgi:hypothetical protein